MAINMESKTSSVEADPNFLEPLSPADQEINFKYLPPPRLKEIVDLGVPYPFVSTFAGPVTSRTVTDRFFIIILVTFTFMWIVLSLHALCASFFHIDQHKLLETELADVPQLIHSQDFLEVLQITFLIICMATISSMFYLFLFLYAPRAMVYISFAVWVITLIAVSLFIEAYVIVSRPMNENLMTAFSFLNISFFVRAVLLVLIIYFKIIYANAFKIAINTMLLVLQLVREIRGVLLIPLIPSTIAIIFTSMNVGILFLMVYSEETELSISNLEDDCFCLNDYKNGSRCNIMDYKQFCQNMTTHGSCKIFACTVSSSFSSYAALCMVFIIFFLTWCYEILFSIFMLVMENIYAKHYFNPQSIPDSTEALKDSLNLILRYHLGTAAYGALVMMFLQFPSFIVNRLDRIIHLRRYCLLGKITSVSSAISSRSNIFYLNFFNHFRGTLFVFTALFGFEFQHAIDYNFKLIYRNAKHFYVPDMLIDTIFKGAKWTLLCLTLIIASYTVCGGFSCFKHGSDLQSYKSTAVIILICVTSYSIMSCYFGVISGAIYAVYICFLTESEMLSFKLPQEPARWEINHLRRKKLLQYLYRPPPPTPS